VIADRRRTVAGGAQCQPCLDADGVALRPFSRSLVRRQVVRRESTGQLLVAKAFEVASGSQMASATVALGVRALRDLANERLAEAVLTAFG
jgi:hypothetical protein